MDDAPYELVDEPPQRPVHGRGHWMTPFSRWLHDHPGQWAIAPKRYAPTNRNSGYATGQRLRDHYGLQTAYSKDDDGNLVVYARYSTNGSTP